MRPERAALTPRGTAKRMGGTGKASASGGARNAHFRLCQKDCGLCRDRLRFRGLVDRGGGRAAAVYRCGPGALPVAAALLASLFRPDHGLLRVELLCARQPALLVS